LYNHFERKGEGRGEKRAASKGYWRFKVKVVSKGEEKGGSSRRGYRRDTTQKRTQRTPRIERVKKKSPQHHNIKEKCRGVKLPLEKGETSSSHQGRPPPAPRKFNYKKGRGPTTKKREKKRSWNQEPKPKEDSQGNPSIVRGEKNIEPDLKTFLVRGGVESGNGRGEPVFRKQTWGFIEGGKRGFSQDDICEKNRGTRGHRK